MAGKYVSIEVSEFNAFLEKLKQAGQGQVFKKELKVFMEGIADEFLRIVQDEIIRTKTMDTRLLLNSFQKSGDGNLYTLSDGGMTIEVGTNVEYASFVNDGHWTNPKGVKTRWVPGYWSGDRFIYEPGAKTGMLLRQKWVEGTHYFDSAIRLIEQMIPGIVDAKLQQWLESYFGGA